MPQLDRDDVAGSMPGVLESLDEFDGRYGNVSAEMHKEYMEYAHELDKSRDDGDEWFDDDLENMQKNIDSMADGQGSTL